MTPPKPTHTPTPWKVKQLSNESQFLCAGDTPEDAIGDCDYQDLRTNKANAAFIVRAVNAHEELVEALKAGLESEYLDRDGTRSPVIRGDLRKIMEQALAKAALHALRERRCFTGIRQPSTDSEQSLKPINAR